MSRKICVAAAQMGPIARDEPRESTVARMMAMMREAHGRGARLVVFPELALTTFFPRWWMEDEAELDTFYEDEMPNAAATPLFDLGRELEVSFYLGYAEILRAGNRKRGTRRSRRRCRGTHIGHRVRSTDAAVIRSRRADAVRAGDSRPPWLMFAACNAARSSS